MGRPFFKASQGGYLEIEWNRGKTLQVNSSPEDESGCLFTKRFAPAFAEADTRRQALSKGPTHVRLNGIYAVLR